MMAPQPFRPALIVVDFQEDFCPPNGSLAVADGRAIAATVNRLLSLPFSLKIATKDYHPPNHVSFASNHPPPNNTPFESVITIRNPHNPSETEQTRLWPDHCVQRSQGSNLVPELNIAKLDHIVEKGQDPRIEMYSAFADPFLNPTVSRSDLARLLKDAQISHVYITGLALDYCVKYTAIDSAKEGFRTYVVKQGTKPVDPTSWASTETELIRSGVTLISEDEEEIQMVTSL